jgi:hypothetical protein
MAIDFSKQSCVTQTTEQVFGIYDDQHPAKNPAYLVFVDIDSWIGIVENDSAKEVTFTAIDHCIEIIDSEGERCDGMLTYDSTLVFVELKDRNSSGWLGKAKDQLENTIKLYKREVGLGDYNRFYAQIVNKQRPYFANMSITLAQEFEDNTGFILRVDPFITIM